MRNTNGYRRDHLFVPPQELLPFLERQQTPFYLYDEDGLRKTAHMVDAAFYWNPGHRQRYAMKANAAPALLQILREEGSDVLVSSLPELLRAEQCGFTGEQITVNTCALSEPMIEEIRRIGCEVIFDSPEQIKAMMASGPLPKRAGVRYNPCKKLKSGAVTMANPENSKFGMNRGQLESSIALLQIYGVQEIGIQAHMAGNSQDERYYLAIADLLFHLAADLYQNQGLRVGYCDLGGGLGLNYSVRAQLLNFPHLASQLRKKYEQIMVPVGLLDVPVHTELGRYVVGRHGVLISRVVSVRHRIRRYVVLDASAANLPRVMLSRGHQHISVIGDRRLRGRVVYSVHGCLSEANDRFCDRIVLPELWPGRAVALHLAGAYCQSVSSRNALTPRCKEFLYTRDGAFLEVPE